MEVGISGGKAGYGYRTSAKEASTLDDVLRFNEYIGIIFVNETSGGISLDLTYINSLEWIEIPIRGCCNLFRLYIHVSNGEIYHLRLNVNRG